MNTTAAPTGPAPRWQAVRNVLAVRLDNLGDVLMTTPALAAIRDSLPQARLTLLCSPAGAAAAAHLPMVDEAWPCNVPWMQRGGSAQPAASLGRDEAALVDRLAAGRFDAAVIFTVCTQSALPAALLCRMAGIPLRLAHCRENPYALLTDWVAETDRVIPGLAVDEQQRLARHEVQRQLALVATVGLHTADDRLRFEVRDRDRAQLAARLRAAGIAEGQPYAVLHPGASAASRRWPAARFGLAARQLAAQGCAVVFSGDSGELALSHTALQAMADGGSDADGVAFADGRAIGAPAAPTLSLAGLLSLGELAALLEGARVLVANNSAPAHLAAAVGTPVVNLYALTNPQHTPWRTPARVLHHDVPCRWCLKSVCPQLHHDCLRQVGPQQVADAALELMALSPTPAQAEARAAQPPMPLEISA